MPRVDLTLESNVERTARVVQLEGIFDVPASEKTRVEFHFDAPFEEKPWQVGLIVGPSGAGKTSVARHLFGDAIVKGYDWHPTRSIVDSFGDLGIRESTAALSSVGFSSPPNWLRPFHVLSNGEQFRATMARALVDPRPLIAVDEFTSVVDRTVAQIGSHAIAKSIRSRPGKQFVAVTCHYDIEEWLQPDWVIEPHLGRFAWRSLQRRPQVDVEIVRCDHSAWRWFAPHHYMSADLHKSAKCFAGLVRGEPACFAGLLPFPHPTAKNVWRVSRVVVRPDYQGIGLGTGAFLTAVAAMGKSNGKRVRVGSSLPAVIKSLAKSTLWRMDKAPSFASAVGRSGDKSFLKSVQTHRRVANFEYVGPAGLGATLWAA
jgi:ABC-type ATPase with predicted acetyltransferase domain